MTGNIQVMKHDIVASMLSDVGCYREGNEDCGRFVKPGDPGVLASKGMLLIVADGMGGHSAGEVASKMAVDVVSRVYYEDAGEPQEALTRALTEANNLIYEAAAKDEALNGMGTTCTAVVLQNGSAVSAHVGDSRLYLVRNGDIYLLTEDHSAVMEMVRRGMLTIEEARKHSDKNIILRALGTNPEVDIATWDEPLPLREGDYLLLCSDGLYDLVEDQEIKQAIVGGDPHSACEALVTLAKERGGFDNITVGVVGIRPLGETNNVSAKETREVVFIE